MELILEQAIEKGFSAIRTEEDIKKYLNTDSLFESAIYALAQDLPTEYADYFVESAKKVRETLLHEAQILNTGNSQVLTAALAYFPAIAELYASPQLVKLAVPMSTQGQHKLAVNILKRVAILKKGDQIVGDPIEVPKPVDLYSLIEQEVDLDPNKVVNIYDELEVDRGENRILLSHTYLSSFTYIPAGTTDEKTVTVYGVPDYNGVISKEVNDGDNSFVFTITINKETGDVTTNVVVKSGDVTIEKIYLRTVVVNKQFNYSIEFTAQMNEIQRYVEPGIPLTADVDLWKEVEFKGQYNVDYIREMVKAIKDQIALLKDSEIVAELRRADAEITSTVVDFNNAPSNLNPANLADYYSLVIPALLKLRNIIYTQCYVEPKYLAVNPIDAHVFESLTHFLTVSGTTVSKMGVSVNDAIGITQFQIIKSGNIPEGTIYMFPQPIRTNPAIVNAIIGAPIIRTSTLGNNTIVQVTPQDKIVFVDPLKVGKLVIQNAP